MVEDLRKGTGTEIEPDTTIISRWVVAKYKSGKTYDELPWNEYENGFGPDLEIKGWEKGLIGMRVGGRRKLIVPSRLAYGTGTLVFVVDLLSVR